MSKDRLRRIGAAFAGFLLLLAVLKATRYSTRKYHIHRLAPDVNLTLKQLQAQLPADVRNVVARAAALARAELEQTGLDEESSVAKSAKVAEEAEEPPATEKKIAVLQVERHLIDASHVGDEESAALSKQHAEKKENSGDATAEEQELTKAVTVKVKAEDDEEKNNAAKTDGDNNNADDGEEGGGEENGISSSAKMAGERENENNHDDESTHSSVENSGKTTTDDKEEEGSNGDDENEESTDRGNDSSDNNGNENSATKNTNISSGASEQHADSPSASSDIHGDSVAKEDDDDGAAATKKEVGTNYNNYSNRNSNGIMGGDDNDSDVDYFGGLRSRDSPGSESGSRRMDTGGPDERLSTRDFGAIFGLAIAHSAVVSRSERARLSQHDIALDAAYERLRLTGELVQLIERYADALENAAAGGEESLVYVRKANAGYGLFAARSLPTGTVLGEYGGRYTRITSKYIRDASEEYTWKLPAMNVNGTVQDGWGVDASEWGNALRFANDLGPGTWNIEMKYVPWNGHWHVIYETKTPVLEGEELSVSYGAKYWYRRSRSSDLSGLEE